MSQLQPLLLVSALCFGSTLKAAEPSVDRKNIFVESVKRGDLVQIVRGPGSLVPVAGSPNLKAVLQIPSVEAADIKEGLPALIDHRHGLLKEWSPPFRVIRR